jgi:large subunit ribosomal protein L3
MNFIQTPGVCIKFRLKNMKVLMAKKSGMTQYFDAAATAHAVTVLTMAEMTVAAIKTVARDGYDAIVCGFGEQKAHRINKAQKGQYKNGDTETNFFKTKEFRVENIADYTVGQVIGVEQFVAGDSVDVAGISKGKGFQGVVKRHGFKGKGPIHNVHHALREPGSIGGGGRAGGRVVKGMKMAGRMGADRITVKNLKVVAVDAATKTLLVKGAVPGNFGGMIEIVKN